MVKFALFLLFGLAASAQVKPAFEVATIKPAAPMDPAAMMAAMQKGGKIPIGATITATRAEYTFLDLKTLMTYAYGVRPYQITGPDWMSNARFDIIAKLPAGSTKQDAAKMLQSLLEDRFKLVTHRAMQEQPVLAIVVGKGGAKLKASAEKPVAIDEEAPLKPGEMKMDGPEGPVRGRISTDGGIMSSIVDMGLKGKMAYRIDPAAKSIHIDFSMTTLPGFADMTTQLLTQLGGGTGTRRIVDMTGIEGNYDAALDISLVEMMNMARAAGGDASAVGPGATAVASDPGVGGSSLTDALQTMGLKLESRKATLEQLIVDHIEKMPTEN